MPKQSLYSKQVRGKIKMKRCRQYNEWKRSVSIHHIHTHNEIQISYLFIFLKECLFLHGFYENPFQIVRFFKSNFEI